MYGKTFRSSSKKTICEGCRQGEALWLDFERWVAFRALCRDWNLKQTNWKKQLWGNHGGKEKKIKQTQAPFEVDIKLVWSGEPWEEKAKN